MNIQDHIQKSTSLTTSYLQTYIKNSVLPQICPVGRWGYDAVTKLLHMSTQGKMLRSALIFLGDECFSKNQQIDAVMKASASLELIQTGLLIHDDIMDNDQKRRGLDSIHIQYKKILENEKINTSEETGKSFAICVGDMAYFLAMRILSDIQPSHLSVVLQQLYSLEISKVTAAQMQDVYGGVSNKKLSEQDILSIYTYKTGRYTCGLPLVTGATIAGATEQTIKNLWKFGTALGILFQIQDDQLNLFGDTKQTGKPVGSDIREGKQTLHRYFLMQEAPTEIRSKLNDIYGNRHIDEKDVQYIRDQALQLHVDEKIQMISTKQTQIIDEGIQHLPIEKNNKILLHEFVEYLTHRKH